MKNTLTMDECVMLNLSTYNELYNKARMLDSIVEDTIATIRLEKREATGYSKLRVEPNGTLVLPAYVMNQIIDSFVARLANQSADFIRSMVEEDVHIINFSNFSFESYKYDDNPLEFDLMKSPEFKQCWEQERAALEQEQEQERERERAAREHKMQYWEQRLEQELEQERAALEHINNTETDDEKDDE